MPDEPGRLVPIHDCSEGSGAACCRAFRSERVRQIERPSGDLLHWVVRPKQLPTSSQSTPAYQKFSTNFDDRFTDAHFPHFLRGRNPLELAKFQNLPICLFFGNCSRETEGDRVLSESLHFRPHGSARLTRIFERIAFGRVKTAPGTAIGREIPVREKILRPDASLISTLGQLNNAFALSYIAAAETISSNILLTRYERDDLDLMGDYARDPHLLEALNRDIRRIDLGIDEVRIAARNGAPVATFAHVGLDSV